MTNLSRTLVAIVALSSAPLLSSAPAKAQGFAVAVQGGTTGVGGGVVVGLLPRINIRAMYTVIPGDLPSVNVNDFDFEFELPSFILSTVDLYVLGGLHLSVGGLLITNDGRFDAVGSFSGRTVEVGGTSYTGGVDDLLVGGFALKSFQPYVGFGLGNPIGKTIGINFNVGVGIGEIPSVTLSARGPLADNPALALEADLQQEIADIEADIPDYLKYYPVVSLSLSIGF